MGPRLINQNAQLREEIRTSLNLVQHDQPLERPERQHWVCEPGQVLGALQVEVGHGPAMCFDELPREGRLAHLACAQDPDHRELPREAPEAPQMLRALDHAHDPTMKSERLPLKIQS